MQEKMLYLFECYNNEAAVCAQLLFFLGICTYNTSDSLYYINQLQQNRT